MNLEQNRQKAILLNRFLLAVVPLLAVGVVADLWQWNGRLKETLSPILPNLDSLKSPLPAIPALELPPTLFQQIQSDKLTTGASSTPVAVKEVQWKLKGVLMAGTKKAFLEDSEGKSVWVAEGERFGSSFLKEIRDHSVVVETEGKSYEIRM